MRKLKYTTEIVIGNKIVVRTGDLNADALLKVSQMEKLLSDISYLEKEIKRFHNPKPLTNKEKEHLSIIKDAIRKNEAEGRTLRDKRNKLETKQYCWKTYKENCEGLQLKKQQAEAIAF